MKAQRKLTKIKIPSAKSDEQPATRGLLKLVRNELKSEFRVLSRKMDAEFADRDARFDSIDARFKEVDARFDKVDARFDKLDVRFDEFKVELNRALVLLEEQNFNNRIVLEGHQALWQRQERIEQGLKLK